MTVKFCMVFWILAIVACSSWTLEQDSFQDNEQKPHIDSDQVCSERKCGNYSYSDILKQFPGIFFTLRQYTKMRKTFKSVREEYLKNQNVEISMDLGDGDSCCPTEVESLINYTMTNIYGEEKSIIHMPPNYQFVPHGFCLETRTSKCKGICVIEPIVLHLLTYNPGSGMLEFDQFVVPGYCSCKEQ